MIKYNIPLPVSEEMLGAYLEGHLNAEESSMVRGMIERNSEFRNFVEDVSAVDPSIEDSIYDDNPNFDLYFELPLTPLSSDPLTNVLVLNPSIIEMDYPELVACTSCSEEEISSDDDSIFEETVDVKSNSTEDTSFSMDEDDFKNDNTEQ